MQHSASGVRVCFIILFALCSSELCPFFLNLCHSASKWCLWSALYKTTVMMWTAARFPPRSWPPAQRIKPSASTPHGTSQSSRSHRFRVMGTGSTAAASAPVVSTWRPAPPMPPRWCGQWPAGRSRPCSSILGGVRSGYAPSHLTPCVWFRALRTAQWLCGTSHPGLYGSEC